MEKKIDHLQLIQGVITRMASNSFALKGWAVTLVAGIFALASKESDKIYFLVAYIPCMMFWWLDSYYLWQERLYRALYNKVRESTKEIDYSMNASIMPSDTSLSPEQKEKLSKTSCFCSISEIVFYVPLLIVSTGIIILNNWIIAKEILAENWFWFLLPFIILFLMSIISNRKNLKMRFKKNEKQNP